MNNGFIKVAAASPTLKVADCAFNAGEIVKCAWRASTESAKLLLMPELSVTGATCGDLFGQHALIDSAFDALLSICEETADLDLLLVVGAPIRHKTKLYNCAVIIHHGAILGLVPKTYLNHGELARFAPAFDDVDVYRTGLPYNIPIGTNLLFFCRDMPDLKLGLEIGEDAFTLSPPATYHVAAGATIVGNLAASNEIIGRAQFRKELVQSQSNRLQCGYFCADAGFGESTTDHVFSGHNLIAERGDVLAEAPPFSGNFVTSEIDLEKIATARQNNGLFPQSKDELYLRIPFSFDKPESTKITRPVSATPFVPTSKVELAQRCETIYQIQAHGLTKRMKHIGAQHAVVGISGGLDSTLALLAALRAFKLMDLPPDNLYAVTMPGFGTTAKTRSNAEEICKLLGTSFETIDITNSVKAHFNDIKHDEKVHDIVFENAQARMRTLILMDLANQRNGLVLGTGDLSELALGWATFSGDLMSMYDLNASVPKTLIPALLQHEAAINPAIAEVLDAIIATPVSPELLPADGEDSTQLTETLIGPYEVHDFLLYYTMRWGFSPSKIFRLAEKAFADCYTKEELLKWMETFYTRFISQQYKRSCLPDGPSVGSVSLSPRAGWQMPSDAAVNLWAEEVNALKKELE